MYKAVEKIIRGGDASIFCGLSTGSDLWKNRGKWDTSLGMKKGNGCEHDGNGDTSRDVKISGVEGSFPPPVIILGLSGGPDSMALFHILNKLREKYPFKLVAAHVNHMFRGEQADEEEAYLQKMVEELVTQSDAGLIIETLRVDVKKIAQERKLSNQDAGHQVRKEFFQNLSKKYDADYVFLAHHQDDRVESFFLHLFHGAGVQGLTALSKVEEYGEDGNGLKVIRPLIGFSKDEILKFCQEQGIFYFKDPSNEKAVYKRNKIRLELIPQLEQEYNSKIRDVILRSVEILEDEDAFLNDVVRDKYEELVQERFSEEVALLLLDKKGFQKLHKGIQRRLVIKILNKLAPGEIGYNYEKIEKILELLNEEKGQRRYKLSRNSWLEVGYEEGKFVLHPQRESAENVEDAGSHFDFDLDANVDIDLDAHVDIHLDVHIDVDVDKIEMEGPLTFQAGGQSFTFAAVAAGTLPFSASFPQPQPCGKPAEKRSVPASALIFAPVQLTLRTRRDGDVIKPAGGKTKKLKKFFMEKKIPHSERDKIILLASGKEIIWIPNMVISQNYLPENPADCVSNKNNLEQSGKKMLKVLWTGKESLKNSP
jgi:tRNA(Ile)-lysidine synthase